VIIFNRFFFHFNNKLTYIGPIKLNLINMKKAFLVVLMLSSSLIFAQNNISGIVSDQSGNPIPGATVVVEGTTIGVVTDFDGNYQINASAGNQLTFSSLGFSSQTITVGNQTSINVVLATAVDILDEVVVSGYQSLQRRSLSGAIGTVDTDEAFKTQVSNAAEALQGRVSGVQVSSGGAPGAAPVIRVRGYSTTNSNDPLYIIDGLQTTDANVLRDINPRDIENISVLKDGSAAIYGARASNGVIVVTTKKGSYNSENVFEVNASYGIANATQLPEMMNAQQHADMTWQSILNDGNIPNHLQYGNGPSPVIPQVLNIQMPSGPLYEGAIPKVNPGGTDWLDELFDPAGVTDISLTSSGGSEKGRYYMSANYLMEEGIMKYTQYERAGMRLNSEFKIGNKLTVGQRLNVTYDKEPTTPNNPVQRAIGSNPLIPVYDTNGNFAGTYQQSAELGIHNNAVADLYRSKDDYNKNLRVIAEGFLNWNITPELEFKSQASIQMRDLHGRYFQAKNPEHSEALATNTLTEQHFRQDEWNVSNLLNYKNSFGGHTLDILAGMEAQKASFKGQSILRTDYLFENPEFYLLSNGAGSAVVDYANASSTSLFSLFGTANWSFNNKYFATVTIRNDKSSRFADENQEGIFPSASLGWLLSEEDWFKSTVFDTFKVRASYGELGNQQIGGSNLALNISLIDENTAFYAYNGSGGATFGATIAAKGNPNLTWENQISTNFALDMGFLDNKLQATIDVFKIETSDLVAQDTNLFSSTAIDASAPFRNIGSMEVTGFDASISYSDETSSGFKWSTGLNLTKADNEVTELINEYFTGIGRRVGPVTRTEVGQPISYFYGRNVIGIFQDASEVASHASQVGAAPGRFKYEDVNNDGIINDDDRTKLGSPHPDLIFGLNFNFEYKNWDMSMFVNGTLGNEVFDNTALFYETPTFFNSNRSTRVLDSWSPSNPDASFPALSETVQNNEFSVSNSFFVRDGSYLRLRSLQVGYTLPSNIASKIGASFARIYYNGTNLLTLTDFPGLDPDVPTGGTLNIGVYDSQYPTRSLSSIGVNLRF
jgi:TonB-linked SusC/RagA family outer membrane protein